jgi:hypothetical protein
VQASNELVSIVVTPVADISIDSNSVEFWKTSAYIAVTLAPRVTLAGIGPVKPVSTPSSIIGSDDPVGVADADAFWTLSPAPLTAPTDIV